MRIPETHTSGLEAAYSHDEPEYTPRHAYLYKS